MIIHVETKDEADELKEMLKTKRLFPISCFKKFCNDLGMYHIPE
ncbi:MAG: hypothetical protein OXC46_03150 [Thaumarchaeota archaeon]|nr:hypothetical protein [Nitrososphaerota archaeon]